MGRTKVDPRLYVDEDAYETEASDSAPIGYVPSSDRIIRVATPSYDPKVSRHQAKAEGLTFRLEQIASEDVVAKLRERVSGGSEQN